MKTKQTKPFGTCAHCETEFQTTETFNAHLPCETKPAPAQAQHSPLPWTLEDMDDCWHLVEKPKTNDWIATIHSGYDGDEANAAFIVRACNNAQRLADALQRLERDIDCYDGMNTETWESVTQAREALAEWEAAQ